ncbi:hypothetical protein ABH906_000531 [Pseudomonas frederiksbergensis]
MIVPTLCVGMHPVTLCVTPQKRTRSVQGGIPTQSMGTISQAGLLCFNLSAYDV